MDDGSDELKKTKEELKNLKDLFFQLTEEKEKESYDIRRVYILKSQVIQLERQCLLLSEALSSRASVMNQFENELIDLTSSMQKLLAHDGAGPTVPISRKSLISHIHTLQKLSGSLKKQSIVSGLDKLAIPQLCGLKYARAQPLTCLDVCSGDIRHINLQKVAKLELELSKLYCKLQSFQTLLKVSTSLDGPPIPKEDMPEKYLYSNSFKKIQGVTENCIQQLESSCEDLLSVSVLHPSAPWAVIQKPEKHGKLDPKLVLETVPPLLQKKTEVKNVIGRMCKVHSYHMYMSRLKIKALEEQVKQANLIQHTQVHFMNCLLTGVRHAYNQFEEDMRKKIGGSVKPLVETWFKMKECQSDKTLREFMSTFKAQENNLAYLSEMNVDNDCDTKVPATLKDFGVELEKTIGSIKRKCSVESQRIHNEMKQMRDENEADLSSAFRTL